MALIAYKNPGDLLSADEWNTIFAAADDVQTAYLNGLSTALIGSLANVFNTWSGDNLLNNRLFFFFNPVVPPANIHPLAATFLGQLANNANGNLHAYLRQYNHSAIVNLVNSLPVDTATAAIASAAVHGSAGGTGYAAGQVLTVAGGTVVAGGSPAQITILNTIGSGFISSVYVSNPGSYSVAPSPLSANPVTGGAGHGATFDLTTGGVVAPVSDDFQVVRLVSPDPAAWYATVYPENGYGAYASASWNLTLDICLQVLTRNVNGKNYAVTLGPTYWIDQNVGAGIGVPEMALPWEQAELFVVAGYTMFPDTWNKYNVFRIHNLSTGSATVVFGSGAGNSTVTVPAGKVKCVRRDKPGGAYTTGYNYLQKMLPGDPRFFNFANFYSLVANGQLNQYPKNTPLTNPLGILYFISTQLATSKSLDATQFWDMGSLYTSLFAPAQLSSLIGDLLVTKGKFLAVRWGTSSGHSGGALLGTNYVTSVTLAVDGTGGPGWTGGLGYAVGDLLQVVGGVGTPVTISVNQTGPGGYISIAPGASGVVNQGNYSTKPTSPVSVINIPNSVGHTGAGHGALFTLNFPPPLSPNINEAVPLQFNGFAGMAALLLQANTAYGGSTPGIVWSFNNATGVLTLSLQVPGGGYVFVDLVDVSTNLVAFLTGVTRWNYLGTPSPSPGGYLTTASPNPNPFLTFLNTFHRALKLKATTTTTAYHYYGYGWDGTTFTLGGIFTVNLTNAGTVGDSTDVPQVNYTFMDSVQKLADCLNAMNNAFVNVQNIQLKLTVFGPVLLWQEIYPIGRGFDTAPLDLAGNAVSVKVSGSSLIVQRAFLLAPEFGNNAFWPSIDHLYRPTGLTDPYQWWTIPVFNATQIHFPRSDRLYAALRPVVHNGADEPWESYGGGTLITLNTGAFTTYEPPNIKRFFESKPIAPDSVQFDAAAENDETGVSMIGPVPPPLAASAFGDGTGINFANWFANIAKGTLDFEAYLAAFGEAARGSGSPKNQVLQLPCQVEHYNLLASQVNGLPVTKAKIGITPPETTGTYFTLDFSTAFLVSTGSGYQVGDQLGPNTGQAATITIQVSSVDVNGAITGWGIAPGGETNYIATYSAYGTPQRPFASFAGTPCHGTGATWDVAWGDGSKLNFVPAFYIFGVYSTPGYWPRSAFFAWNGATPGGKDPVSDYFGGLVQSILPDGYATPVLNTILTTVINTDGSGLITDLSFSTSSDGSYVTGHDPTTLLTAATYRWITVDAARTLYAAWGLPFVLNRQWVPYSFHTVVGTPTYQIPLPGPGFGYSQSGSITLCGFVPDMAGQWVGGPVAALSHVHYAPIPYFLNVGCVPLQIPVITCDFGVLNQFVGPNNGAVVPAASLVWLENSADLCAVCVPVNCVYDDPNFVMSNLAAALASGGGGDTIQLTGGIIPLNYTGDIEGMSPEVQVMDGTGGENAYEQVITTNLANARLVTFSVDNS